MRSRSLPQTVKLLTVGLLALGGCGNELESLSDSELQDRSYQCRKSTDQTPGQAISCDNYRRECQRRRDLGRYAC